MTVLVTGAAGFLGSQVTADLVMRGEGVRALIHPSDSDVRLTGAGLDVVRADVADRDALAAALTGVERVIHCAARTGAWGPASEYHHTNVSGLETLVRAAMVAGVHRVVHVSSITVHGNDVGGSADESTPLADEPNPYSRSKVAGERVVAKMIAAEGARVSIVRPGWIYGPGDTTSFARFARMIEERRMLLIGSGANHLPLIYVGDAARGAIAASVAESAVGRAYVLVSDEPVTQRDYLTTIARELGAPGPTRRIPYRLALTVGAAAEVAARLTRATQPPPVMRYGLQMLGGENRFSIARARRELGFTPEVAVAEGVRRAVAWYRTWSEKTGEAVRTEVAA